MSQFNLAKFDIEYFKAVIEYYGLHQHEGAVGLRQLIESLDVDFRYSTLTPNVQGMALIVPATGEKKIRVKHDLDPCWRRFIIGHELGHMFQYNRGDLLFSTIQDLTSELDDLQNLANPVEAEAYAISAYLYVPLLYLQRQLYLGSPFEAIAADLEIPSTAVKLRYQIALHTGEFLEL